MKNLASPKLVINEERCKQNIADMCARAKNNELKFRPHFKTHQSQMVGEWFKENGVEAITVSSIGMANYFAEVSWKEITIAFPVNIHWTNQLNELARKVDLNILISDFEIVNRLDSKLQFAVNAYIEIDSGSGRSGLHYSKHDQIEKLAHSINKSSKINLKGCYSHAGHTYRAKSKQQVENIGGEALRNFSEVRKHLSRFAGLEFCWGDTPSCSILKKFEGVDALSAGNFVFYDAMQQQIGSCHNSQVAVAIYCPVVSKKEETNELCIHGGAVHFSKDQLTINERVHFGILVDENWHPVDGGHVRALSQEHGMISVPEGIFKSTQIGDSVIILPVHSCLTAQAMGIYTTIDGHIIDHFAQKSRPD